MHYFIDDIAEFAQNPFARKKEEPTGRKWRRRAGKIMAGLGAVNAASALGLGALGSNYARKELGKKAAQSIQKAAAKSILKSTALTGTGVGIAALNRKKRDKYNYNR